MAIQQSLAHPTDPTSLEAIRELGTDSRHYTMVRGWLMQILVGDMSIVEADPDNIPQVIRERILFLQEAIRAIDLE